MPTEQRQPTIYIAEQPHDAGERAAGVHILDQYLREVAPGCSVDINGTVWPAGSFIKLTAGEMKELDAQNALVKPDTRRPRLPPVGEIQIGHVPSMSGRR